MIKFLLRLFIKDYEHTDRPQVRTAIGKLSGLFGIIANLLLFAGKLTAGLLSGALSIVADAMNNFSDAASSIVTLIGFKLAERPADEDHPYGHARYEYLSALAVAAMIIVIGFETGRSAIEKIIAPTGTSFTWLTAAILLGSIAVKLWLAAVNVGFGRHICSDALIAVAADSRNDCIATGAILTAAIVERFTGWRIDGYVSLGVALFILYSGVMLAKETISPLLGEAASPELRELIVDYISSQPCVLGYHDLMVHDYGPGQRFATLHVEMDNGRDPLECHELIDDMERECLRSHNVHLVIHYDPVVTNDPCLNRLRERAGEILKARDNRLSVHDFRMVQGAGHTNLIFDVALPTDMSGCRKELQSLVETTLSQEENTTIYTVITFDHVSFN